MASPSMSRIMYIGILEKTIDGMTTIQINAHNPAIGMDQSVLLNTRKFNNIQHIAVVAKNTDINIITSFAFTISVSPFFIAKGDTGAELINSFGLITGVLHNGHLVNASSSFTPQLTQ